ncbi:MAG TPA: hypothetical protein DCR24_01235, partial [Bacillus bacterium]|nr:hypothetical protein [Bacillus sp. (in: firmicutes)]
MVVKENFIEKGPRDITGQVTSPYFVCTHKDTLILAIDEGGTQLLGFKNPDELIGKSIFDFLYKEEQKTAAERIKLLEQGIILSARIMTFSISGVPMDLEVESNPVTYNGQAAVKTVLRFLIPHCQSFSENNHSTPLILNSNKGIIITTPNGIIQSVSESFTRLTGFSMEDVIGNNPRMWKSKSYTPAFYEKMWNSILKQGSWQGELWNKRRDGSHYLMKVNIYSILNKEGRLVNYIAVYTDLTEIDKLEQQLKEREEQYRTLVELSPSSIILTQNKKVVYANPPALSLLGLESTDELIGKRVDSFLTGLSHIDTNINLQEKFEFTIEDQLEKDGAILDIEVSSAVITFQGQQAVLTVIKEITERKNIERELRESEEQYRFIAENSSDMIGRLSGDGTILYISPACRQILGYEQDELIGSDIYQRFHPDDLKTLLEEYGDPKDFSGIATFSYRMQHKNGEYIWGETTVRSVKDNSGKLSGMMFATR